ncbi:MAG: hypothetical protein WC464_02020 [Bdellovibrionales bacterium]
MPMELSTKVEVALWWITSIAVSVLCCSILFVLFASHLVDVREMVQDTSARIDIISAREDRILAELELIRKHAIFPSMQPTAAVKAVPPAVASPAVATEDPAALSVSGTNPDKAPDALQVDVPAIAAPVPAPVAAPAPVSQNKPVEPVPAEKK